MTNANDQIKPLAWVKREDGIPELNTEGKGLTKREYFAAMAMQGIVSVYAASKNAEKQAVSVKSTLSEAMAIYAVDVADALINALNQTK